MMDVMMANSTVRSYHRTTLSISSPISITISFVVMLLVRIVCMTMSHCTIREIHMRDFTSYWATLNIIRALKWNIYIKFLDKKDRHLETCIEYLDLICPTSESVEHIKVS